ncbi:MAG: heat-inducible transcription repressor HrcA [Erysipelotrichales bacterium]|nr:heat-inducible transcription repressor HrcA [Erysipelotrichales bacterium]
MLSPRQEEILKAIVEEFIRSATPVGSNTLLKKYDMPYSSATIRNEMMALEREGLLEKTHTSSGRVPSTEGYRYYVENLMEPVMTGKARNEIASIYDFSNWSLEDAIQKSCDVVSQMTSLTSVVLGPEAHAQTLRHIKMFPVDEMTAVAVFITDQGHTENRTFKFDETVSLDDITRCTEILNDRLAGTPISEVAEKMKELKPVLANEIKRSEVLFNAFFQAFVKFASRSMYYSGAGNMLYQPEFSDIEKLKQMMRMLEDSSVWKQIAANSQIAVTNPDSAGSVFWTEDYAIVSHPVGLTGDDSTQLMVVGPKRMDYKEVMNILDYMAEMLERLYRRKG